MAALFIEVRVDAASAADPGTAKKLTEVCPVSIFAQKDDGSLAIRQENLDECTLCDLCLEAAPKGAVKVIKLYACQPSTICAKPPLTGAQHRRVVSFATFV